MSWSIDKNKAIRSFLKTYRAERSKKLVELDIQFMISLETDDIDMKRVIILKKNSLREFPTTITNDSFTTLDELRNLWPINLLNLPDNTDW